MIDPGRERLMRPSTLALLIVAVCALLVMLFPRLDLNNKTLTENADDLSIAYLRLLLRAQPNHAGARLLLARQERQLGYLDRAEDTLSALVGQIGPYGMRARLIALEIARDRYNTLPSDDPRRIAAGRGLISMIRIMNRDHLDVAGLKRLAQLSLELGRPALAAGHYQRCAAIERRRASHWLALAARWYHAAGMYQPATQAYLRASRQVAGKQARLLAVKALDVAVASGDPAVAMALADALAKRFPRSTEFLKRAIKLALANNKPQLARRYGIQLLALEPTNRAVVRRQLQFELSRGQLKRALALGKRLAALQPNDAATRLLVARIALWNTDLKTALVHWKWLAFNAQSADASQQALNIARAVNDRPAILELLKLREARKILTLAELIELASHLEFAGFDAQAAAMLRSHLERLGNDDRRGWEYLSLLQQRRGRLSLALEAERQLTKRFGVVAQDMVRQATLLWRLRKPREALKLLASVRQRIDPSDKMFWPLLGELAWQQEDDQSAYQAYKTIWDRQQADHYQALRLLDLTIRRGNPDDVLKIGTEAYLRFKKAHALIAAMEVMSDHERYGQLSKLLRLAARAPKDFARYELYWRLRAEDALRRNRLRQAERHYRRALAMEPMSQSARLGWLQVAKRSGDLRLVARLLRRWEAAARSDPAFWLAYGQAYDRLGRSDVAVHWYRRLAQARPKDLDVVLEYADSLDRIRKSSGAWRLRRYALREVGPKARPLWGALQGGQLSVAQQEIVRTYAELLWQLRGATAARPWIRRLLRQSTPTLATQKLAVRWQLAENNPMVAEGWLHRLDRGTQRSSAGERAALAIAQGDGALLAQLIADDRSLPRSDLVEGLSRLGEHELAWQTTLRALYGQPRSPRDYEEIIAQARGQLERQQHIVEVEGGVTRMSHAEVLEQKAHARLRFASYLLDAKLTHASVHYARDGKIRDVEEWSPAASVGVRMRQLAAEIVAGARILNGKPRFAPEVMAKYQPDQSWSVTVRAHLDRPSEESPVLRASAHEKRVEGEVNLDLFRVLDFTLLGGYRRLDAIDGNVGQGYNVVALLSHSVLVLDPVLQLRLDAHWSQYLESRLPLPSVRDLLPAEAANQALLPDRALSLGLGASLSRGQLGTALGRALVLRYTVGAWLGWLWPNSRLGLRVDAGLGLRLFAAHELSVRGYYADNRGGEVSRPNFGLGAHYILRFGP
ncbi:MAG: tetratricopeptide repeat protein [Deltaproteobacteria bacterium]|nr:tetratricopeptide repeat protein [Deltaproteobacteria bacterium]